MNDTEIVTSRQFAAAPPQVFRAFSDPAILARWWGPQGFTNTFKVFDMAPGGLWRFVMHGPDGVNYPNDRREPRRCCLAWYIASSAASSMAAGSAPCCGYSATPMLREV